MPKVKNIILYCALTITALWIVIYHVSLIKFPYQQELREGAIVFFTHNLLINLPSFSLEALPVGANPYGALFQYLCYPFAKVFGATLIVHRIVSGICIALCCLVVYKWGRKADLPRTTCLAISCLFYLSLLYGSTPLARPDSLGLLLFLLSLFIPYRFQFSTASLFISIIINVAILYTKIYFLVAPLIISIYLFTFISKLKSLSYSSILFLFIIIALNIGENVYPTFINLIFGSMSAAVIYSKGYATRQFLFFSETYAPLMWLSTIILVATCIKKYSRIKDLMLKMNVRDLFQYIDITHLNYPLISYRLNFSHCCLIISGLILALLFGKNDGAWMTYFYQLLSPFLLLSIGNLYSKYKQNIIFVIIVLICTARMFYLYFPTISELMSLNNLSNIDRIIDENQKVFASPAMTTMLLQKNRTIYDTGLSGSSWISKIESPPFKEHFTKLNHEIDERNETYKKSLNLKIYSQFFDILLVSGNTLGFEEADLNNAGYYLIKKIPILMAHTGQHWEVDIWSRKGQTLNSEGKAVDDLPLQKP